MPFNISDEYISSFEDQQEAKIANEKRFSAIIKDLRQERELEKREARFLVSMYYSMQEERIRSYARAKKFDGSPTINLMARSAELLEDECRKALDRFSNSHIIGRWMRDIDGIGPVTSAGLLAFVDINICNTAGKLWSFAGLTPESKHVKGQKINYNPNLRKLCWQLGESFVKVSNKDTAMYGKIYKARKEYEQKKNEAGEYADQAVDKLRTTKIGKDTDAYQHYSAGHLPPAHIHARARRYAVKIFLSHLQSVWFEWEFKTPAPKPFAIAILGHADFIVPPELKVS